LEKGEEVRFRGMCCGFARDLPGRTEKSHGFLAELPVIRSENVKFPNTPLFYTKITVKYKRKHLADKTSVKVKFSITSQAITDLDGSWASIFNLAFDTARTAELLALG